MYTSLPTVTATTISNAVVSHAGGVSCCPEYSDLLTLAEDKKCMYPYWSDDKKKFAVGFVFSLVYLLCNKKFATILMMK